MSASTVIEILHQIEQLPVEDRLLLEQRLAAINNQEWEQEAASARVRAHELGIDQVVIDKAIEDVRYGS